MSMNIWTPAGSLVKFANPNSGTKGSQETAAEYLKVGTTYVIEKIVLYESHTEVYLLTFSNIPFNSVHFDNDN